MAPTPRAASAVCTRMPRHTPTAEASPAMRPWASECDTTYIMSCPGVTISARDAATYRPSARESTVSGVRGEPVERQRAERAHPEGQALLVDVEAGAVVGRGGGGVAVGRGAAHEVEEARHLLLEEREVLGA